MNVERDKYRAYRLDTNSQCDDYVCHIVLSITVEEMKSTIEYLVKRDGSIVYDVEQLDFHKNLQILVRENCNTNRSIGK